VAHGAILHLVAGFYGTHGALVWTEHEFLVDITLLLPIFNGFLKRSNSSKELGLYILSVNEPILETLDFVLIFFRLDANILDILGRLPC
jgi:hypothetical protein